MYRERDLQACLAGLVGWRQNVNPDYPTLPPSLLQSDSGLYFQDEHPLINLENIDQADKNYDKFNYPIYDIDTEYEEGEKIRYTDGKVYESLQDENEGNDPTATPLFWVEVNLLAQRLEQITNAAALKVMTAIFTQKKLNEVTKSIFENIQLFDGAGSLLNKEIKMSRFVGFEIFLKDNRDLLTVIRRLGTQFTQANPDFVLYVFHSSQEDPIYEIALDLTKSNSFEWTRLLDEDNAQILLKYLSDEYSPGGSFYIGYYEDELVGQAINKGYDFGIMPQCTTCNNDYQYWSNWSQYLRIQPFTVQASDIAGKNPYDAFDPQPAKIWDIRKNQYAYTRNYGLNLDLTVKCDVTDFFCRERSLFADAISKQVAIDVLRLIGFSTRNNPDSKMTKDMALYELNNKDNNTPGASKRLDNALKAVSFDVSDLNDACLPCNQKYGSNWATV